MSRSRILQLLSLAALLLADLHAPAADAHHQVQDAANTPIPHPDVPGSTPVPTGVVPLDRTLDEALFGPANRTARQAYEVVDEALNAGRVGLPQPLRMYADGTGLDPRHGGFGPWREVASGSQGAWTHANGTGHTGQWGITTAADGAYPFSANSLYMTPELDLRNGLVVNPTKESSTAEAENAAFSSVWTWVMGGGFPVFTPNPVPPGYIATTPFTTPADALYQFRFDARFNLAAGANPAIDGRDTVQVLLLSGEPPHSPPPGQCSLWQRTSLPAGQPPACTLLLPGAFGDSPAGGNVLTSVYYPSFQNPLETHYNAESIGKEPRPSFTGYLNWTRYTVDLTPWAGQTVRVGFWLQSQSPVGDLFFDRAAGFRGFQLDNLELTEHAPTVSVRVRPPVEPSARPLDPGCVRDALGRCPITIPPDREFTVAADIVNMGLTDRSIQATVTLREEGNSTDALPPWISERVVVKPGATLRVQPTFPGLKEGEGNTIRHYVATVTADHRAEAETDGVDVPGRHVDGPGSASQAADADPSDDVQALPFDVHRAIPLVLGALARSAPSVAAGDSVRFTLPVLNAGILPTNVTVDACLVNWANYVDPTTADYAKKPACTSAPLNEGQGGSRMTFPLAPLQTRQVNWTARPLFPGQYKLFIHAQEGAGAWNASDFVTVDKLLPGPQQPFQSTYRDLARYPVPAGAAGDLSSPFWNHTRTYPISLFSQVPATSGAGRDDGDGEKRWIGGTNPFHPPDGVEGALQVANDDAHLYVRLALTKSLAHNPLSSLGGNDVATLLLDDRGDRKANGTTEDGARYDGTGWADLHYDPVTLAWVGDQASHGDAARNSAFTAYEFIRPLAAGGQDLSAGPGQLVRLLLGHENRLSGDRFLYTFPASANPTDGGGVLPRNGTLGDEMRSWQPLRLVSAPPPATLEAVTPGFGVDRNPPPFFQQDPSDCAAFGSWTQSKPTAVAGRTEKWSCAPFGATGRPLLFEGTSPDSPCASYAVPCSQYSFAKADPPESHELFSPPIQVGGVADPYLILNHQYSTQVWVVDDAGFTQRSSGADGKARYGQEGPTGFVRKVVVASAGRVLMETLDKETGAWGDRVTLTPDAGPDSGYSSPEGVGIGATSDRLLYYGHTVGKARDWDYANDGGGEGVGTPANSGCLIDGKPTPCAFWWPAGHQPLLQPPGAPRATGQVFTGSPWRVDRFPLFGVQPQFDRSAENGEFLRPNQQLVEAAGKTVRFVFQFFSSSEPAANDPYLQWVRDYGWRIGGLAVQEGPRFRNDLAVTNITVEDVLYDPAVTGVGPNTILRVRVGVRNNGNLNPGTVEVSLTGRDPTTGQVPCRTTRTLNFTLGPGADGSTVFSCRAPASEGGQLLLQAEVNATASDDDFPADNFLAAKQAYAVRAVRDVAARIETKQPTGAVQDARLLAMRLENRGNVPLSGITLTQSVLADSGDLLATRTWTLGKTLAVGNKSAVADLKPDPSLNPQDTAFLPPGPGTYRIALVARLPGDADPSNDGHSVLLRAEDEMYRNGFDGEVARAPGAVAGDGAIDPVGVWRVTDAVRTVDGARVATKVLRAGDPTNGEIPANASAVLELPPLDLTMAKGATLSFSHRYDLESSFDAGRVEVSTDNGTTWRPLIPERAPLFGLPDGYPSIPLVAGPLLDGEAEGTAIAYTGLSQSLPDADPDGWVKASFDLGQDPGLRRTTAVDAFSLGGLAPSPPSFPERSPTGDNQFFDPSWDLHPETPATQQRWWIQDEAYDVAPHNATKMWWSGGGPGRWTTLDLAVPLDGCAGTATNRCMVTWWEWRSGHQDSDPAVRRGTGALMSAALRFQDADQDGLPNELENNTFQPSGDKAQWNVADTDGDGWSDGKEFWARQRAGPSSPIDPTDASRAPTSICSGNLAAEYEAQPGFGCGDSDGDGLPDLRESELGTDLRRSDTDGDGLLDKAELDQGTHPLARDPGVLFGGIVRSEPSGWVMRALDTRPYAGPGGHGTLTLRFGYDSASTPELRQRALDEKSLGFFVSDVRLQRMGPAGTESHPVGVWSAPQPSGLPAAAGAVRATGPWTVTNLNASNPNSFWDIVGPGGAASTRGGLGWGIEEAVIPGRGPIQAWRFADGTSQGYPGGLDVRLVTPVVDLTRATGDTARLQFDHRFGFEARCPASPSSPTCASPTDFLQAIDGGAVEVQVFDEAHGTFGPWQQVGARFRDVPSHLAFSAPDPPPDCRSDAACGVRHAKTFADLPGCQGSGTCARDLLAGTGYNAIVAHGDGMQARNGTLEMGMPVPGGTGTSFEPGNGTIEYAFACNPAVNECGLMFPGSGFTNGVPPRMNWMPFPIAYAFSGSSGGWRHVDWDVSPLVGQRVRFAFHAASTSGFTPTAAYPGQVAPEDPGTGWSVANVAVVSQVFQGAPARLRLHVATDGTNTKGEWSLDDLSIAGMQYRNQFAVLPSTPPTLLRRPGAPVVLEGRISNLGTDAQSNLVLAAQADDLAGHTLDVAVAAPTAQPFSLGAPGSATPSERPFRLELALPPGVSGDTTVRLSVLQRRGAGYDVPLIESPGAARAEWALKVQSVTSAVPVPPLPGRSSLVVAEPAIPEVDHPITFRSAVRNDGTEEPALTASWTFQEVLSKGGAGQPGTQEAVNATATRHSEQPLGVLARGATAATNATFTPRGPGLYRAHVDYLEGGAVRAAAQLELLVETSGRFYHVSFANATQAATWADTSTSWVEPDPRWGGGGGSFSQGSPEWSVRFRSDGADLLWGVDDSARLGGLDYCHPARGDPRLDACNGPVRTVANTNVPESADLRGLEGSARSGFIDLSRVPQGEAILTVENRPRFQAGDGFRLEAIPYQKPANPRQAPVPAFTCNSGQGLPVPMSFALEPASGFTSEQARSVAGTGGISRSDGRSTGWATPNALHPLDLDGLGPQSTAVVGGNGGRQVTLFQLDQLAATTCPNPGLAPRELRMANYTIQLRLHTGTLPGHYAQGAGPTARRTGDQGLKVGSIDLASTGVQVSPTTRLLPMQPGVEKEFLLQVRNVGQQADTFNVSVPPGGSLLPPGSNVTVLRPSLFLEPGAAASVPYRVRLPGTAATGSYLVRLEARSASVSTVADAASVLLSLQPVFTPDLAVALGIDGGSGTPIQVREGERYALHAKVYNLGTKDSKPVNLRFLDVPGIVNATGLREADLVRLNATLIDEVPDLPRLCAAGPACVGGGRTVGTAEWSAPGRLGPHTLVVQVDPEGRLTEGDLANNLAFLPMVVLPRAVPDLAVTSLDITGLGPDGMAEEGAFLGLRATVANLGAAPAAGISVTVQYGSLVLPDRTFDFAPGEARVVETNLQAVGGDAPVLVEVSPAAQEPADAQGNNRFEAIVHARRHNLTLAFDPPTLRLLPGGVAPFQLRLASAGTSVDRVALRLVGAPGWGLAVTPNPVIVAPGSATVAIAAVEAPGTAPAGGTVLRLRAEPFGNPAAGIEAALPVEVAAVGAAPELSVQAPPAEPGPAVLHAVVSSRSNDRLRLDLALAGLPWPAPPAPLVVEPFANRSIDVPFTIPADAAPGLHAATLEARNATGVLVAQRPVRIPVLPRPAASAQWTGSILPGPADAGQRILRMGLLVRNEGNVPLRALASAGALGPGLGLAGNATPATIPVRGAATLPIVLQVASDAPDPADGSVEVWAQPTEAGLLAQRLTVRLPRLDAAPDLWVARIDRVPAGPQRAGEAVLFRIQVENQGPVASPPTRLRAFVNGDLLADPAVPALAPGERRLVNVTATFGRAGSFLLTALADGEGAAPELQEANNGASLAVAVQEAPLLSAHGVQQMVPAPAGALPALLAVLLVGAWARRRRGAFP